MSHELDFSTGHAAIAIREGTDTPWHQYGFPVPEGNDIDEWRIAARLAWEVREQAIFYAKGDPSTGKGVATKIPNKKALVRDDTQDVLGIVSEGYETYTVKQVTDFMKRLCDEFGMNMNTMGALQDGRKIWGLADAAKPFSIMGQDVIKPYLLVHTGFDGATANVFKLVSERVVCHNTLTFAMGENTPTVSIAHNTKVDEDLVLRSMGLIDDGLKRFEDEANQLAMFQVDLEQAIAFFTTVLGKEAVNIGDDGKIEYSNNFKKVFSLYEGGTGQELRSAHHTGWGLVNAVTEYQDHVVKARDTGTRLNSAWFGQGSLRKQRAFDAAKELAGLTVAA